MLPNVSLPRLKPTSPAAVAAAEPALEPLEPSFGFHGLRVTPVDLPDPEPSSSDPEPTSSDPDDVTDEGDDGDPG